MQQVLNECLGLPHSRSSWGRLFVYIWRAHPLVSPRGPFPGAGPKASGTHWTCSELQPGAPLRAPPLLPASPRLFAGLVIAMATGTALRKPRRRGAAASASRRMLSPDRLALPDYEYLAQRHVLTYMEDAVSQLLENREDISQYGIARFFTEYFNSVCQGTHILFREFSFIQATPHNRASFLRAFWRCFRTVGKNGDLLTMKEYHCLLQLLCPDFPLELTQKAARIVLMDDAMDCLMSFSDFLFAFQIQFYYSEFLESVAAIYQDLLTGKNPNTVIVPTSSSGQHRQRPALTETSALEGVEASLFYQYLENLCDRHKYSCPPPALVKEVLSNVQRLTFYGFLVALSKHHGINQALGALPDKGDLMHDPAMDEELERLVVRSRLHRTSQKHRSHQAVAFGFRRSDKLEALETLPSASTQMPYSCRWESRE
ncbi:centriolar satellite-associated tubulin polyglutamylase complex regulator 1 isoform X2 [Antechinus flavipes]|uniref:centriolar satellite-associated tubulin polyglutamylase complex regulator 1 isoform X2 n=2 Tax=Dasyuridae TaxID=9277 RepID=UPI0022367D40|nr:centriolar satellite-associated tubulin polyglutamylase complex regulator 1 isoform X2 [Antechinus flavipes]